MLLLVLLFVCTESKSWLPPIWSEDCTFTRDDVYKCLKENIDINPKDDQITKAEIDAALEKHVSVWMKPLFWFVGSEDILKECDVDKNGVITPRDWEESKDKCLPFKKNWCSVQWFCED